jgi:RNA polymerase sigma-70 factor (ECF subfamily)
MKVSADEFEKLAMEQMDLLFRVACRLTRDRDRAGDLLQETYLRAFRGRGGFDLQCHGIRPWLIRIMHNLHVTRADRESRQPVAMEIDSLESWSGSVEGATAFAGDYREQMDEQLVKALDDLPSEYQVVLLLWAVDELSYKEIAEAIDVPIGTVMSRLHRAKHKLATSLRHLAGDRSVIRE